jgi:hypothetical protein
MFSSSRSIQATLLGAVLLLNGLFMLAAPETWYHAVPTVPDTGPFNPHFVRDIGCAYSAGAIALFWLAREARAWPAALAGSLFFILHALTHVWDFAAGREEAAHFAIDAFLVLIPAAWGLRLSWPRGGLSAF